MQAASLPGEVLFLQLGPRPQGRQHPPVDGHGDEVVQLHGAHVRGHGIGERELRHVPQLLLAGLEGPVPVADLDVVRTDLGQQCAPQVELGYRVKSRKKDMFA